jgi:hypothetical protein
MIKHTLISLIALTTFCTASAQTKVFTGYINDTTKDPVEMHLRTVDRQLYGYYFYRSDKKIKPLHSKFAEHAVQIFEGDEVDGQVYFDGILEDSSLAGKWQDLPKYKFRKYALKLTGTDSLSKQKENQAGYYELNAPGIAKNVRIVYINNKYFYFHANIGSKKCTGYIFGIAKVTGSNTAVYTDAKCKQLSFTFAGKNVTIKETNCNNYHGSSCNFSGAYKLKK